MKKIKNGLIIFSCIVLAVIINQGCDNSGSSSNRCVTAPGDTLVIVVPGDTVYIANPEIKDAILHCLDVADQNPVRFRKCMLDYLK